MNAKSTIARVLESSGVRRISVSDLIREYSPGEGRHWFDRDKMEAGTHVDQAYRGPGGIYFVAIHNATRPWSATHSIKIHYLKPVTGQQRYVVPTVQEFSNTIDYLEAAREKAKDLALGYTLTVSPDDLDLDGDLMDVGAGTDKITTIWNSLNKEDFVLKSIPYHHFSRPTPRNPIYRQARVLGHFKEILRRYGITRSVPTNVLVDMHDCVKKVMGETEEELTRYGGGLEHFLAYAQYLETME
jgi:hypothetical protein